MGIRRACSHRNASRLALSAMTVMVLTLSGCPPIEEHKADGPLAGTWTGDVTYAVTVSAEGTGPQSYSFTGPLTVSFTQDGLPDTIDLVAFGHGSEVALVPAGDLLAAGDTAEAQVDSTNPTTGQVTHITVDVTVNSIENGESATTIELAESITFSGETTGTMAGTFTLQAHAYADNTLNWNGTSKLTIGNDPLHSSVVAVSAGTLSKH